jgi:DNA-directed RNA polymerase subunit M/transcription elongation factor TFIIS
MNCKHCNIPMQPGKAIQQTYTGIPDFIGGAVVTLSPGGPGKLVDCLKCPKCGYSVTKGNDEQARTNYDGNLQTEQQSIWEPDFQILGRKIQRESISIRSLQRTRQDAKGWACQRRERRKNARKRQQAEEMLQCYRCRKAGNEWRV